MSYRTSAARWAFATALPLLLRATTVPALSFEDLVDRSELVVSGRVTRSWSAWDAEHKYIWTHHEISVASAPKGRTGRTVIVSEPGGLVADGAMGVAGVVPYGPGENVAIFLERMPNGYLRTAGWSQGKLTVDSSGRVHITNSPRGAEVVGPSMQPASAARTPLRALEGMKLAEFRTRVGARAAAKAGSAK